MNKLGIHMHTYIRRPLVDKNGVGSKREGKGASGKRFICTLTSAPQILGVDLYMNIYVHPLL